MTGGGGGQARAWLTLTALLMAGAVLSLALPATAIDWQPELARTQVWRAWTAAFVHWSDGHLATNLMAAAVVGAYGWQARVPRELAWAWCAAWPLTQLGLLLKPELAHYGGLSGVLHAGVAIVCLWLLLRSRGGPRVVGALVALGLIIKIASESPWGPALQSSDEFDIAVAPLAHATGALAGLLCGALALSFTRNKQAT